MNKFLQLASCKSACLLAAVCLLLVGCPRPGFHYRDLKKKVEEIGPDVLRRDASLLMRQYKYGQGNNHTFQTINTVSNSFRQFEGTIKIKPDKVSVLTAGLGSHRMGIMVVTDQAAKTVVTNSNIKKIAENIYYWSY